MPSPVWNASGPAKAWGRRETQNPVLELALICEVLTPEGTDASDLLAKLRLEQGNLLLQVE